MGSCMIKKKSIEHIDKRYMPLRQYNYFKRKYKKICHSGSRSMDFKDFSQFFRYLQFSEETLQELFQEFKDKPTKISNSQSFMDSLERIIFHEPQEHINNLIYKMFFKEFIKSDYLSFIDEFDDYIGKKTFKHSKGYEGFNDDALKQVAIGELGSIVARRDKKAVLQWLSEYVKIQGFLDFVLEGGREADEKIAFTMYNEHSSKKKGSNNVMIIHRNWVDKMVKYMKFKYQSLNQMNDSPQIIENSHAFLKARYEALKKEEKNTLRPAHIGLTLSVSIIDYHPGEINNMPLAKNFPWELKKNLRYTYDYIELPDQVYNQLVLAFGGGPHYERKVIQGCFELNPFIIRVFEYSWKNGQDKLTPSQHIKLSRSETLTQFLKSFQKNSDGDTIYHRNPGCKWMKIQELDSALKLRQMLLETSFAVLVPKKYDKIFIENMMEGKSSRPALGDMFKSEEDDEICVLESQNNLIPYVYLDKASCIIGTQTVLEFDKKFKPIEIDLKQSLLPKSDKGGIINLGNTCYISAGLQALFSVRRNDLIFNQKGIFGNELMAIIRLIEDQKVNAFPTKFKACFHKKYPQFVGQSKQHDVNQFLKKLLQGLALQSPLQINNQFNTNIEHTYKCKKCKKTQTVNNKQTYIFTLPLRNLNKVTMQIQYVTNFTNIKTISLDIEEDSSALDWLRQFQYASGALPNKYMLCEIVDSRVNRVFEEDTIFNLKFKDLKIQKSSILYAYKLQNQQSGQKLRRQYYLFKGTNEHDYLATKVFEKDQSQISESQQSLPRNRQADFPSFKQLEDITVKEKNFHKQIKVSNDELRPYIKKRAESLICLSIYNFDENSGETIGYPFILQIQKYDPLSAVRHALEKCLKHKYNYKIRLSPIGNFKVCQYCMTAKCPSECFIKEEKKYPIQWFEGIADIVIAWKDEESFFENIKRKSYTHINDDDKSKSVDNFDLAYKRFLEPEQVISNCTYCKIKNGSFIKESKVRQLSNNLILHLSRDIMRQGLPAKIHTRWKLEQKIKANGNDYELKSVIMHKGENLEEGRYTKEIKDYLYDDSSVTRIDKSRINSEQIYILMYTRVKKQSSKIVGHS